MPAQRQELRSATLKNTLKSNVVTTTVVKYYQVIPVRAIWDVPGNNALQEAENLISG